MVRSGEHSLSSAAYSACCADFVPVVPQMADANGSARPLSIYSLVALRLVATTVASGASTDDAISC